MTRERTERTYLRSNRRDFLRGTATAGVALSGLPVITESASAAETLALSGLTWEGEFGSPVTYNLQVSGGVLPEMEEGVRAGIQTWKNYINEANGLGIGRFESADRGPADIDIKVKRGGGLIAGQELTQDRDGDGAANKSRVLISGSSFGSFDGKRFTESVTVHELGHSFQLGHFSGDGDVMSPTVQDPPITSLSACDKKAFETAHDGRPSPPEEDAVTC